MPSQLPALMELLEGWLQKDDEEALFDSMNAILDLAFTASSREGDVDLRDWLANAWFRVSRLTWKAIVSRSKLTVQVLAIAEDCTTSCFEVFRTGSTRAHGQQLSLSRISHCLLIRCSLALLLENRIRRSRKKNLRRSNARYSSFRGQTIRCKGSQSRTISLRN